MHAHAYTCLDGLDPDLDLLWVEHENLHANAWHHRPPPIVCREHNMVTPVAHLLRRVILTRHQDGEIILARNLAKAVSEHVLAQIDLVLHMTDNHVLIISKHLVQQRSRSRSRTSDTK